MDHRDDRLLLDLPQGSRRLTLASTVDTSALEGGGVSAPFRRLPVLFGDGRVSQRLPAANCNWCRYQGPPSLRFAFRRCLHPKQLKKPSHTCATYDTGLCSDWNPAGECTRYRPTLLTRLLAAIAARRAPSLEKGSSDCLRCRFRGLVVFVRSHPVGLSCRHPLHRFASPEGSRWIMGLCNEWNRGEDCMRFEPKRRLRAPVFRDVIHRFEEERGPR